MKETFQNSVLSLKFKLGNLASSDIKNIYAHHVHNKCQDHALLICLYNLIIVKAYIVTSELSCPKSYMIKKEIGQENFSGGGGEGGGEGQRHGNFC